MAIALVGLADPAPAQSGDIAASARAGATAHAQRMRRLFPDAAAGRQATPDLIPELRVDRDPAGAIASFQPGGSTITARNAFFQNLGSNGRTCFTCHRPEDGWAISAQHVRERFETDDNDPLFRLTDGAACPSADVSTKEARRKAYRLLLAKGLIRIGLPMPSQGRQFEVVDVKDPYGCNTDPTTGLTSPTAGVVSVYRRPLPAANLGFLSAIMWDGREPDLFSQALDATLGHAQAALPPTAEQKRQIVAFEGCDRAAAPRACAGIPRRSGIFAAQILDSEAGSLADRVGGGPAALFRQLARFFIGVNDPIGGNPTGASFSPEVFRLYGAWNGPPGKSRGGLARSAIARGEQVFNTNRIEITGVAGLNDVLNQPRIEGFCGTCHDTPNVGNHSVKAPLDIGVADAGKSSPPALDIAALPVFTLWCTSGPLAGRLFEVTDPGRALITGQCADIGKLKGPVLRGLAARAPYFHNGSAASLGDVVEFYDRRFGIGLSDREKADLTAFLNAL
jgi:hypothetical protein